jgi:hypothetical protein
VVVQLHLPDTQGKPLVQSEFCKHCTQFPITELHSAVGAEHATASEFSHTRFAQTPPHDEALLQSLLLAQLLVQVKLYGSHCLPLVQSAVVAHWTQTGLVLRQTSGEMHVIPPGLHIGTPFAWMTQVALQLVLERQSES